MRLTLIIAFLAVLCGLLYFADRAYDRHIRERDRQLARKRLGLDQVTVDDGEVVTLDERRSA